MSCLSVVHDRGTAAAAAAAAKPSPDGAGGPHGGPYKAFGALEKERWHGPDQVHQILDTLAQRQAALEQRHVAVQRLCEYQARLQGLAERRPEALSEQLKARLADLSAAPQPLGAAPAAGRGLDCDPVVRAASGAVIMNSGQSQSHHLARSSTIMERLIKAEEKQKQERHRRIAAMPPFQRLVHFLRSPAFEVLMGVTISVDILLVAVKLQWQGYYNAFVVGLRADDAGWPAAEPVFVAFEYGFAVVYVVELAVRLATVGCSYYREPLNALDLSVVLACCVDVFVLGSLGMGSGAIVVARAFRLCRIRRIIQRVPELKLIVDSLRESVWSIIWAMPLICMSVLVIGMIMCQLMATALEDSPLTAGVQSYLYTYFGTPARSAFSMIQFTFTTGWGTTARLMMENVSPWYALVWVVFVVLVNFAMMQVIAALFLRQLLAAAASQAERSSMESMKASSKFIHDTRFIFRDYASDGKIDAHELQVMLEDPKVIGVCEQLSLELDEVQRLFNILCSIDGAADYEELLNGMTKMKHHARKIDAIHLQHEQTMVKRAVDTLALGVQNLYFNFNLKVPEALARATSAASRRSAAAEEDEEEPCGRSPTDSDAAMFAAAVS